jgi:Ca2+-binding RTX toxin-like protein
MAGVRYFEQSFFFPFWHNVVDFNAELIEIPLGTLSPNLNGFAFENVALIVGTNQDDHLIGTAGPDSILGLGGNDILEGLDGGDIIEGGAGDDVIEGGASGDILRGGSGVDTLSYATSDAAVFIALDENGEIEAAGGGHAEGDTGNGFENITGSDFADLLIGNGFANVLTGRAGNDSLFGLDGDDTLLGGGGSDFLMGGMGADILNGGAGIDTAGYIDSSTGVTVTLGANGSETVASGGYAQGDRLSNIENLQGSNFNDTLTGNNLPNVLRGVAGDDTLEGRGGDDELLGGDGNDALLGGAGQDRLLGDDGDDTLVGGDAGDLMYGGSGDDTLWGDGGNDYFSDPDGDDTFIGGAGDDTFRFSAFNGHKTITDFVAGADSPDIIEFEFSLFPFGFDEILDASAQVGNDVVIALPGGDSLTLENVLLGSLHEDDFLIL